MDAQDCNHSAFAAAFPGGGGATNGTAAPVADRTDFIDGPTAERLDLRSADARALKVVIDSGDVPACASKLEVFILEHAESSKPPSAKTTQAANYMTPSVKAALQVQAMTPVTSEHPILLPD